MSFHIDSRASWNARAPRPRSRQSPANIREFILHHPAAPHDLDWIDTDREADAYMREIQNFHMGPDRGWSDFAYNFAVFQDGQVYRGRGLHWVPAAQLGHNTNTCAVLCVVGNAERPSEKMIQALIGLKDYCDGKCGRDLIVKGHGDVTPTECPGALVRSIIPRLQGH